MSETNYLAIWEFRIKPESTEEFERAYGPEGSWARLFRRSVDYHGTELLRDQERAGRYLTIDRWTSPEALWKFKQEFDAEYTVLDNECERLTEAELRLGGFESTGAT